jgi:HD-GYP domain-containing protein (c-di-GMP phosphodiesterase class II)
MFSTNQLIAQGSTEQIELIEQLLAIGTALSSNQSLEKLLELILAKSREITCSDAGSIYLIDKSDGIPKLLFKAAQNDSIPSVTFREFAMPLTKKSLAGYAALTGESLNLPDAYNLPPHVPYQIESSFDRDFAYKTRSVLVIPMSNQNCEIIGVVQLINRKIQPDAVVTTQNLEQVTGCYSTWDERIVLALASMAAVSLDRNQLQQNIENLFDSFVRAAIALVEVRDPSTHGHSERVAALCVRLCEAVNCVTTGPLGNLYFSDRQIQEIRYAALLHDFGEVGVPEAILQKQKKLSPQQLESIRQRLTIAQRTLELEAAISKNQYLQNTADKDNSQLQQIDIDLAQSVQKINRYWELIQEINQPQGVLTSQVQSLSAEAIAQLTELSQATYRDMDGELKPLLSTAEMVQLMVSQGNLTPKDRLAVQAHVTHSYEFLKRIPWIKHLQAIPNIVLMHHEKLDGTGYPQGWTKNDIPLQTQILTIADIYDALTTSERPYRPQLSVNSILQILKQEAAHNRINQDLLDLFERDRVFEVLGHGA